MNVDQILENLTPEERLTLLERLLKGEDPSPEKELSIEERVSRLEQAVFARGPRWGRRWGPPPWAGWRRGRCSQSYGEKA